MTDRIHADLIDAWLTEAMILAHECTLRYSDMENDSEDDHLHDWVFAKMKLADHLKRHPGPSPRVAVRLTNEQIASTFGVSALGMNYQERKDARLLESAVLKANHLIDAAAQKPSDAEAFGLDLWSGIV